MKKTKITSQTKSIWDKESENYSFKAKELPDYQAYFFELREIIGNPKNKKILEVGSGSGTASGYLAKEGAEVYLVDTSGKALAFSRKYFKENGLRAKFFQQDAFKIKFHPNRFDVVFSGGLLEHFVDDQKIFLIKKMWEIIKPGGILLISVPNCRNWPFMIAKKLLLWRGKWSFGYEDELSVSRLKKLAQKAGILDFFIYAYNPIVGWWFFPYGKEVTQLLGLNKVKYHRIKVFWGQNLVFVAKK